MKRGKSLSMIAAVALTGTGLLAASPADAKSRGERPVTVVGQRVEPDMPTHKVGYRDLNLASPAGEKALNRRVGSAVELVCATSVPSGYIHEAMSCHSFAWGGARPQIARAVMRAREIASTGTSAILPVAIALSAFRR